MTTTFAYPQPQVTGTNKPLIEAWQRGELRLQSCRKCQQTIYFPRDICPYCWSDALEWSTRSGRGRIVAFTLVNSHVTEAFASESPVVFAEIDLEEGGVMLARIIARDLAVVKSGAAVLLVGMPDAQRYPLPTFQLART